MKRSRLQPADSLDLLLDTMCNTFGGIILIAILVALVAREKPLPLVEAAQQATSAMIERRLATAEADFAAAQQLHDQLAATVSPANSAAAGEKRTLEEQIGALEAEIADLGQQTTAQARDLSADPGSQIRNLLEEQRRITREIEALINATRAQDQNSARLQQRLAELGRNIQDEQDARIVTLRFPRERARITGSVPVIFQYGKMYPLHGPDGERNQSMIAWKARGDARHSIPRPESGWHPTADLAAIQQWLRTKPKSEGYLAFYVFPDSIAAFREVRDAAVALGWEFGLSLSPAGAKLLWGSEGSTPPPL
jgi:hypothetical protein